MQRILTIIIALAIGASAYWFWDTYVTAGRWQAEAIKSWDGCLLNMQDWWFENTKDLAFDCWLSSTNNLISVTTAVCGIGGKILWRKKNVRDQNA